jgi:hypothetical protein
VPDQHGFEVAGIDVEAAADDHVLPAVHQRQEAVGIEAADVAGADEALAVGRMPFGFAGLVRLAVVAAHHGRRTAHNFTNRADLAERNFVPGLIDQADVVAFGRLAHRRQLVRAFVGLEHHGAAALGHAVVLDQPARPAAQDVGLERGGKGGAGAELHAEARQVEGIEGRMGHQARVLNRHQHAVRGAMAMCQFEVVPGIELGHQYHGAPQHHAGEETDQGGVGVERRRHQGHRVGPVAVVERPLRMDPAHAVRLHDALGRAGGARGIDDVEGRLGTDRHRFRDAARRRQPCRERCAGFALVERYPGYGDAVAHGGQFVCRGGVNEEQADFGIGRHVGDGVGCRRGRQRRHRHSGAQGAEEYGGVFERGAGADRDGFPGAHTLALQGRGDAIHHRIERGEGNAAPALDQGGMVRSGPRLRADQFAIGGEGLFDQVGRVHSSWSFGCAG